MGKILAFLTQPAPSMRRPWVISLTVTAVVFLILMLSIRVADNTLRWKAVMGFSLVTMVTTLIWSYVLPKLFKGFYAINTWNVWKMLVNNAIIILMISIGNTICDFFMFGRKPEILAELFMSYILITLFIGLLPTTIASLIVWNHHLRYNLQHSSEINSRLSNGTDLQNGYSLNKQPEHETGLPERILLRGSTKETVEFRPENLLYIESSGNYLIINYLSDEGIIKQKQVRNTIANIQQNLSSCPRIVRCHRGFIVNLSYTISAKGNAQGLQLKLAHTSHTIPVSRNYLSVIRESFPH